MRTVKSREREVANHYMTDMSYRPDTWPDSVCVCLRRKKSVHSATPWTLSSQLRTKRCFACKPAFMVGSVKSYWPAGRTAGGSLYSCRPVLLHWTLSNVCWMKQLWSWKKLRRRRQQEQFRSSLRLLYGFTVWIWNMFAVMFGLWYRLIPVEQLMMVEPYGFD